jgi:uncharacterized protein with von Willebrand factor type A (vWA) domain
VPEPARDPDPDAASIPVAFARVLRGAGLTVPAGATEVYARSLVAVGAGARSDVYWAGRATLVRRPEDVAVYDRAFAAFFAEPVPLHAVPDPAVDVIVAYDTDGPDAGDPGEADDAAPEVGTPLITVRWSRAEVLRHRDFAEYTPGEFDEARRLIADLRVAGAPRRSRRRRRVAHTRGRPDLRHTVRRALRSGGEAVPRASTVAMVRARRVVLLCDVSGSMEPYSRALLRFLHAAVVARGGVEAFAIGTRLTRITPELASRDPDIALAAAARRVVDLSGGTRLGAALHTFNDEWGLRGMARGAVVVIVSDGWDRGEPDVLAEQMARLQRVAHRVVWVNPLKASDGYAPLAQGMAAALPFVDEFVEGHSLASLEHLAEVIAR